MPIKELREDKHTSLELANKGLGPTEAIVLGELVKVSRVLTSLDVSANELDPKAGKALADALSVNRVLKSLDVRFNSSLGEEGKQALRDAVKGRDGFELLV